MFDIVPCRSMVYTTAFKKFTYLRFFSFFFAFGRRKKMDRPIVLRTSVSAEDFWSRVRDSQEVSPNFKVRRSPLVPFFDTPYNRQMRPFSGTMSNVTCPSSTGGQSGLLPPVKTSRSIERVVLQEALREIDENDNANIRTENIKLKDKVRLLEKQLAQALRINHALTGAMVRNAERDARY